MFQLLVFAAYVLAVVSITGAALDRGRVRRSWRVVVWAGVFLLLLPLSFVAFYVFVWLMYGDNFWFY